MSVDYYKLTKEFLVNEGKTPDANILAYVQALSETIANMKPRSQAEGRRLVMAAQQLKEIKKMVLFCALGWRSALATKSLVEMGFQNVAHVEGGFDALKKSGLKVVTKEKK